MIDVLEWVISQLVVGWILGIRLDLVRIVQPTDRLDLLGEKDEIATTDRIILTS